MTGHALAGDKCEQPPRCQVDSVTALIRCGVRIGWPACDRLPCA
ncbi:hypothetical protein [Streptomyces silvensis]|nr:hypothetical protein [Streptomyces silvensis]